MAQRGPAKSSPGSDVLCAADAPLATSRREFLQILIGGSTLAIGGVFLTREEIAALPGPGNTSEFSDVGDFLIASEQSYKYNLVIEVTAHNRVRFVMPRQDKGQGIATALAMVVAEEMDADYDRVDVELGGSNPERPFTITGGSSGVRTMWEPVRTVAANVRQRLVTAAALRWGVDPSTLSTAKSMVFAPDGRRANYGELSAEAAALDLPVVPVPLKPVSEFKVIGTPRGRKNARAIVTGTQKYTLDLGVADGIPANAVPAVVARPPQIKGRVVSIHNQAAVEAMPGVVGVAVIDLPERGPVTGGQTFPQPTAVAVAARTFKEAFDARDALDITWAPGPLDGVSDADIQASIEALAVLSAPPSGVVILEDQFDFPFIAHAALEVMTAIADVRADSADVWYASQTPLYAAQLVAEALGLPDPATEPADAQSVRLHVTYAGGAFGRHLFAESAVEAALISQALGVPIKLLWTRADDMKHGRFRPMTHHELRATWTPDGVMRSWEHRIGAVEMDLRHGLGDALTAGGFDLTHMTIGQGAFGGTVSVPYEFGDTGQFLTEQRWEIPTASWRSIYSGFTNAANEIFVDEIARAQGIDEVEFRLLHLVSEPARRCLEKVVEMGNWGRPMPAGHAQGVAVHPEYRSAVAYLVEIDTTGAEPRLTRAYAAVDAGIPINPKGLESQMQGALIDGFSAMFRASNHLDNGAIRESSYTDFRWARMHHAPFAMDVHVFPALRELPGGAGELGLPPGSAVCVNAYTRATGLKPRRFPIGEFA